MVSVSVIVVTFNEEANIKACLDSVSWADELIVVDSMSTDNTLEIAGKYPKVKLFTRKFCGFGSQKKFALEQATGDWVLSLDADERINEKTKQEILKKISEAGFDGFYFRRNNFILGRFITDAKPANLRLFKRSKAAFSLSFVHESVILNGRAGVIKEPIEHSSSNMADIASCLGSLNRYSSLSAQNLYLRGRRLNCFTAPLYIIGYPCYVFIRFVAVGGFFTGRTGFVLLFMRMLEAFLNYLKLWEMRDKK